MDNIIKIGYQGLENSNNNRAAERLAKRFLNEGKQVELIPLVTSPNVAKAMREGSVDFGVMAYSGTDGWLVPETQEAMKAGDVKEIDRICMEVHHFLFKKNAEVPFENLKKVASHPAALLVCHNHIHDVFSEIEEVEVEDTALSAKQLSEGILPEDTAIICSEKAGTQYGLCLIKDNMQDRNPNGVNFILAELAR